MELYSIYIETDKFDEVVNFYEKVFEKKGSVFTKNRWTEFNFGNKLSIYNKLYDEEKIKKIADNRDIISQKLPYKNIDLKTKKILEQLTLSSRALAELKGYANTIPNMHILINAVTINEAKDSSAIENIVTTHDDIYKVLTESGYKEENAV